MIFIQELSPPLGSFTTGVPRPSNNATRRPRLSGEGPEHLPSESLLARTTLAGEREAYSGLIEPAGSHTCHHTPSHTLSIPLNLLYIPESPQVSKHERAVPGPGAKAHLVYASSTHAFRAGQACPVPKLSKFSRQVHFGAILGRKQLFLEPLKLFFGPRDRLGLFTYPGGTRTPQHCD